MDFVRLLNDMNDFVWGPVMLAMLVGTGVFLTIRLKFLPWRNLFCAIGMVADKAERHEGDISPVQSLMTALSGTFGAGNIVGVATAMVLGGPGRWRGCGSALSSGYRRNTRSRCWRSSTA